jgi:hypothetical protein
MNQKTSPKTTIQFIAFLTVVAISFTANATFYVSNLQNAFGGGGIGDIHGLFQGGTPYGNDIAHFQTGSGTYSLNFITLEFTSGSQYVNAQLVQNGNVLATLGNPQTNPQQTQWPGYTTFINFYPTAATYLNPLTQYDVVLSNPAGSGGDAGLLFSVSSAYSSPAGWTLSPTSSGNPYAAGEYLKFAVDATAVPEPNPLTLFVIAALAYSAQRVFGLRGSKHFQDGDPKFTDLFTREKSRSVTVVQGQ